MRGYGHGGAHADDRRRYNFMRLTMIRSAMAGAMSGGAICEAVDYLADGGYIEIRTAAENAPRAWQTSRWKAWSSS